MKASLIPAHPDPFSFNHAIALSAAEQLKNNDHDVFFHDLYAEGAAEVEEEIEKMKK